VARPPTQIKQSKSEPIVQRHLDAGQSVEELRESKHRKSKLKDVDKIGEKLRERSAPRSSLDESGSSRKSSISSGRKKFISGGKEFAVTLFVNEADKNKILEMLHRAKNVISKKVEKVMGRKTTKAEISHADALKTVLQNWVEEEEIKSVQVGFKTHFRLFSANLFRAVLSSFFSIFVKQMIKISFCFTAVI